MNLKPVIGLFVACATLGASEISALWPDGKMPGAATDKKEWATVLEKRIGGKDVLIVGGVSKPTIELFRAEAKAPTGFVIICPGGGYSSLAYDYEGTEIAQWLNARGVSAMVLKYRVPDNPEGALMDAQRAVRLARANAEKWNIAPNKIAVMGFSAGANLCARLDAVRHKNLRASRRRGLPFASPRLHGTRLPRVLRQAQRRQPLEKNKTSARRRRLRHAFRAREKSGHRKEHTPRVHCPNAGGLLRQRGDFVLPRAQKK